MHVGRPRRAIQDVPRYRLSMKCPADLEMRPPPHLNLIFDKSSVAAGHFIFSFSIALATVRVMT